MKQRKSQPKNNRYYIRDVTGGLNGAVAGSPTIVGANVLANCVGFANGRFNEIINDPDFKGIEKRFRFQLVCNAENFIESAKRQGLKISSKPTLGGIMVWQKGATLDGRDGAGHVAVVEAIYKDGTILTSESGWGSREWAFKNLRRNNENGRWGQNELYRFRGCIVNPSISGGPIDPPKLVVDGIGGTETVYRMQEFFGTTADGVISGQNLNLQKYYPSLTAVQGGSGGSPCIKKLQRWVGASQDGVLGEKTVKAWQKKLNVDADGIFGVNSMKAWQKYLNSHSKPVYPPEPKPKKKWKVIDISEFQSSINWAKAKADGIQGAIIRCGLRGAGSGKLSMDAMFLNHIKGAYKAGIPVGIYMFTEAINAKEGREEADYAIKMWETAGVPISFPIGVDTENVFYKENGKKIAGRANDTKLSRAKRTEAIKAFCERIKEKGYTPMIYASTSWLHNQLDMSKLPYDVWVAQYNDVCQYEGKHVMWQYTSEGRVAGARGDIDMNHCYIAPKKVSPPKAPTKKAYSGSYPTAAEIKTASNAGTRDAICAWCKKIANSGKYKYKVWTDDPDTHKCPICHPGSGNGWNCIGFSWASWRHGGKIPCKCNCGIIDDGRGNKMIKMTVAEATKLVQERAGIKDVKVIINKKGIPADSLAKGDIILYYEGNEYTHSLVYVGGSKVSDCGRGNNPNIKYGKKYSQKECKIAIRYTGGKAYLESGDRGDAVKKIQKYLNWYGSYKLDEDGIFGAATLKAVKAFQKTQKLTEDGLVGEKTIKAMKAVKK